MVHAEPRDEIASSRVADRSADASQSTLGDRIFMMGELFYLLTHSPFHRGYSVADIVAYFMVPIQRGQFRIYRTDTRPVGFVVWGWFSDTVAAAYAAGDYEVQGADWRSGPHLWFVEFVAPFGHANRLIDELRSGQFATDHGRFLRRSNGRVRAVDIYGKAFGVPGATGTGTAG